MPFLMSFALQHEIATLAWIDNASVQFPLNIYATKGLTARIGRLFVAADAWFDPAACSAKTNSRLLSASSAAR